MDKDVLVESGHALISLLDAVKQKPLVAVWLHNLETDAWRFWVVPPLKTKKEEFFLTLSQIFSQNRDKLGALDISDIEFKTSRDPLVEQFGKFAKLSGLNQVFINNTTFNGFLVPEAILIRVDL